MTSDHRRSPEGNPVRVKIFFSAETLSALKKAGTDTDPGEHTVATIEELKAEYERLVREADSAGPASRRRLYDMAATAAERVASAYRAL